MQILSVNVSELREKEHSAELARLPSGLRSVQPLRGSLAGHIHSYGPRSPPILRSVAAGQWSSCDSNGRRTRKAEVDSTLATLLVVDVDHYGAHVESTVSAPSWPLRCFHTHVLLTLPSFCLPRTSGE